MLACKFSNKCWRYSYSQYLLKTRYVLPPERMVLLCEGYATLDMMPDKGIFAENMPLTQDNILVNICPAIQDNQPDLCYEYKKESRRIIAFTQSKERLQKYQSARPRVWIPKEIRKAVAQRDHYRCVYCNRAHNQYWQGKRIQCVVDHAIPLALGGHETAINNLVFACRECNQDKGVQIWKAGCRIGYYLEM